MDSSLGYKGKDRITGFEGIVTGYVQYVTGCNQLLLAPKVGKDGSAKEAQWFDQQRVVLSGKPIALDNGKSPGFDKAAPKR